LRGAALVGAPQKSAIKIYTGRGKKPRFFVFWGAFETFLKKLKHICELLDIYV
jgi:hypothetical protein